jgi:hypothetical protein
MLYRCLIAVSISGLRADAAIDALDVIFSSE